MPAPTSALAMEIAPQIKQFIIGNAEAAKNKDSSSAADGAEDLSNAIAYGVCVALTSTVFLSVFGPSICLAPPPVPPAVVTAGNPILGTLMQNFLSPQITEI